MNNVLSRMADDLRDQIQHAAMSYEVWRCLSSRDSRPKYVPVMNQHIGFFAQVLHASFLTCVVTLYALYEKRNDTLNFSQLQRQVLDCELSTPAMQRRLAKLLEEARPTWIKLSILRNEALGHVTVKRRLSHTYERADVCAAEIEKLLRLTKRSLNFVGRELRGIGYSFPSQSRADTLSLLKALQASASK